MAVPLTGPLSQLKLAREAKHADYDGSQDMGTISLYDLVNGGQLKGSTVNYPAVNQSCVPNPADRSTYNSFTIYTNPGTATLYTTVALTAVTLNTVIYSSASGSIYTGGGGFIAGPAGTVWFGNVDCSCPSLFTNTSTGVVTSVSCSCP